MEKNKKDNQIILIGNINEITDYLKQCEKKYVFVQELIDALKSERSDNRQLN